MSLEEKENVITDEITEILLNTREQGEMMEQLIKNQIQVKDELINKLYKELEHYKQGEADRFVNQIMKAIIKVRKDMKQRISSQEISTYSLEEMQKAYTYIYEDLTDLLEQQNIDEYSTESGEDFDASIHQPKIENTTDVSLNKKVKRSVREGYRKDNKVLIPEHVIMYKYKEEQ